MPVAGEGWAPPVADIVVPLKELPYHWRVTEIVMRCRRPSGFEDGWTLAGRVRGALGHALRRSEMQSLFSRRSLPPAYRLLFTVPPPSPSATSPFFFNPIRPFVLFTDAAGETLTITLRLFGYGAAWLREVREALAAALGGGITLAPGARVRAPLPLLAVETRQLPRPVFAEDTGAATVAFESPTCLARGPALAVDREAFLGSLFGRLAGLAAWHGIALEADFATLAASAEGLGADFSGLRPVGWDRVAVKQNRGRVPMTGVMGTMELTGPVAPFAPALALAPLSHLGSHTAFGMGRCRVTLFE